MDKSRHYRNSKDKFGTYRIIFFQETSTVKMSRHIHPQYTDERGWVVSTTLLLFPPSITNITLARPNISSPGAATICSKVQRRPATDLNLLIHLDAIKKGQCLWRHTCMRKHVTIMCRACTRQMRAGKANVVTTAARPPLLPHEQTGRGAHAQTYTHRH